MVALRKEFASLNIKLVRATFLVHYALNNYDRAWWPVRHGPEPALVLGRGQA